MNAAELLTHHLEKKRKTGYSLRALARDLAVSPTFVSNILRGKKKIPVKLVGRLIQRLDIDGETALEIHRQLLPNDIAQNLFRSPLSSHKWQPGNKKQFSILRQWFYVAIMELVDCKSFDGTALQISKRLGIALPSVEIALRELTAVGLLTKTGDKLVKTNVFIKLSAAESIREIRYFHKQMLKKAEEELNDSSQESFEKRLITGITLSACPTKIAIAKKMLSDSLHEIANYLGEEEGTEVYHLAAQLFPLTKD